MLRVLLLAALAGLIGCGGSTPNLSVESDGTLRVVATVGMVADIVRNVGGKRVTVEQLMGAGVDPHLYKATRDDVQTILTSDLVFYGGLMLEGKMSDTLARVGESKPVIAVTERIAPDYLLTGEDASGHHDPHVWMDVAAWSQCVTVVADALADADPTHTSEYRERAKAYQAELAKLHEYGLRVIATIPPESRVLVTSHDAFNYFGRAYDIEVQGVQGISTESEAGLRRVNDLVDLLVERKVQAVFVESSVPRKNIDALIEGARSRGHEVRVGGELYSDAMGPAGSYTGTYIGMLDHNITLATRALGGEAPAAGLNGKLDLPSIE